jgi:hypothetical protein
MRNYMECLLINYFSCEQFSLWLKRHLGCVLSVWHSDDSGAAVMRSIEPIVLWDRGFEVAQYFWNYLKTLFRLQMFVHVEFGKMVTNIFWAVTFYSPVEVQKRFEGAYWLHLQGICSMMSVNWDRITRNHNLQARTLHNQLSRVSSS